MGKTILYNMPLHELLQRGKKQGLWPIPSELHSLDTETILRREHERTGHAIKYIRGVYRAGRALNPDNWPSLCDKDNTPRYADVSHKGRGKFNNKPNPKKRQAIVKAKQEREAAISHGMRSLWVETRPGVLVAMREHELYEDNSVPIRTNGKQLEKVKDFAPVLTNARMRKKSKNTTSFSTGFAPPSRKDNTQLKVKPPNQKRFRNE